MAKKLTVAWAKKVFCPRGFARFKRVFPKGCTLKMVLTTIAKRGRKMTWGDVHDALYVLNQVTGYALPRFAPDGTSGLTANAALYLWAHTASRHDAEAFVRRTMFERV